MNAEEELIRDIGRYSRNPLGFVRYAYPWGEPGELEDAAGPHIWQREILEEIGQHLNSQHRFEPLLIAIASGHGVGKSAEIAMISDWALSTCEDCRIVVTANTESQLVTKTWPEVTKWFRLSINAHWWNMSATRISVKEKAHDSNWRMDRETWSENNTEAFAGLHNKGKRIVVIYDEASAISDKIWEVTEGALTDESTEIIWLAFGNPTKNTGRFRECWGRYKHRWRTRQLDSRTIDGTNKAQIEKWIADYGEDSDFCRVRVRGEFPRAGSSQLIPGDLVAAARKRRAEQYAGYWKILSMDVARFGDDQTVIGMRQGPRLTILDKLRGLDTVQTANRVMVHILDQQPRCCVIDGDGVGGGVVDYVNTYLPERWQERHKGPLPETFHLQEFHGGASPNDPFMYFNKRAESWGKMRTWLETADIPDDPELAQDLTAPEYFFSAKNQIQLERKEDMKKRGLASPDGGDMLAMSFAAFPAEQTEEEALATRLAGIEDPLWRAMQQIRATLDRERNPVEDNRPDWMREGQ